ncbi:MAG: sugar ABC transporter permease [Rhodospirillales bacterium]|nr:sugar ABC transporter permease [Rhodospirillales bacterium]MDE0379454.1 sugar ABC transporter permease [Rhodospirillales bacterium]
MTSALRTIGNASALWFILPCLFVLAFTSLYPVGFGLVVSLTNWNWGSQFDFVGGANYSNLLSDAEFWTVIKNTIVFATFATAIEVALGFYLAVQVDKLRIRTDLIRALIMMPLMVSGIVVALMSKVMFDPFLGIINHLIGMLGFGPSAFYGAADTAMPSIIGVDVWWQTAFVFIIMLAGLRGLPTDPVEAARVEGASEFTIFWRIKFPMLRSLMITVVIIRAIDTLKVFDIVFGTTGGGPALATEVVQTFVYRTAYSYQQIGKAMTAMILFSLLILVISLALQRLQRRGEQDA